jgi:hypothetical protein
MPSVAPGPVASDQWHAAFAASAQLVVSVHELQSNRCEPTV